jgi:hypothetical protein
MFLVRTPRGAFWRTRDNKLEGREWQEAYLLHFDPGGYWWPPTYSTWTPTIASFSFLVFAQFTIFSSFLGPELLEPF